MGLRGGGVKLTPPRPRPSISWFSSTPAEKGLKKINFIPNSHAYLLTDTFKQNNFYCGFTVLVTCRLMWPRQERKLKIHQNEISFLEYTYRRCKVTPNYAWYKYARIVFGCHVLQDIRSSKKSTLNWSERKWRYTDKNLCLTSILPVIVSW